MKKGAIQYMTKEYDLVVLGGGPGGYVAAIRASQLGMHVAIVEKNKLGGTCLHQGCIPTKSFLKSAKMFREMKNAENFGIEVENVAINFANVQARKNNIVKSLYAGVQQLIAREKINLYKGTGRLLAPSIFSPIAGSISVEPYSSEEEHVLLTSKNVLIATGSQPSVPEPFEIDGHTIITSDEAIRMEELPTSILIIGGGVIGIEWASMLSDFGVDVTVIEQEEEILQSFDHTVVEALKKSFHKKGIRLLTKAEVLSSKLVKNGEQVNISFQHQGKTYEESFEKVLIATGRRANTENIGIENTNIQIKNGWIQVNEFYQTNETHIYAIGDVIGGMQLAHVASREGILAVEHMANKNPYLMDPMNVPFCIYSSPEIASVGFSEEEAKRQGIDIEIGTFPFQANGKAMIDGETEGFVKIISDRNSKDVIGIHMIGPQVTNMISEGAFAKLLNATAWEISQNIYPHPSLSEVIGEAAMAIEGQAIHI